MRGGAKLKGADHSMLSRASNPEALGFLSGEVSLASKPEELLIAIAHRCRKLIIIYYIGLNLRVRTLCSYGVGCMDTSPILHEYQARFPTFRHLVFKNFEI